MDPSVSANPFNSDAAGRRLAELEQSWSALQRLAPLRPIRSETDEREASRLAGEIERYLEDGAGHLLDGLLAVITALRAEGRLHRVAATPIEPRETLRQLLDQYGLRQKDLADIASPTVISDILAGRRAISKNVAKGLAARFHTDVGLFL